MKFKKYIIYTAALLLCAQEKILSQQLPQYTNYMLNYFAVNPAAAGTPGCLNAKIGYRAQWVGIKSAPQTAFFCVQSDIKKRRRPWAHDKFGWGLKIENDATGYQGPITKLSVHGAFAFHKPIGQNKFLSVGIYAGIIQYDYKFDNVKLPQTSPLDDPITAEGAGRAFVYPDLSPGIMYYDENSYVGYSIKNAMRNKLRKVYGSGSEARLVFHHYLTIGRRFGIATSAFSLIPSVNIRMAGHIPPTFDLTLLTNFNNIIDVGFQYRYIDGLNTIINLKFKGITLGYCYDYNLSQVKYGSGNGHEIIFGYKYCVTDYPENVPKEHCPAYR